ncbi:MAG: PIG-L family deacetylase [Phycisphaeraceae bacterium]|nr:PIG-L family deacetylase [Phycisphaeraceae bacterium]
MASTREPPCLLIAMAHGDDMEFYCGGTVAKFVSEGWRAVLVMFTANMPGADLHNDGKFLEHPPEAVAPAREEEVHAGASELGVDTIVQMGFKDSAYYTGQRVTWLGDPDYNLQHPVGHEPLPAAAGNFRCIQKLQAVLDKHKPEIVITHNFSSGFEHTCVATMVNQAFGQAVRDGTKLGSLWIAAAARHSAWESDVRLFPSPNILIDITDHWTTKLRAIRAHKTQHVESAIPKIEAVARYWGIARQCRYAEPFSMIQDARYR